MIPLTEARQIIIDSLSPLPRTTLPLYQTLHHTLADPALADSDYPSTHRSMMDGFAIPPNSQPGPFKIIGSIAAGEVPTSPLAPNETIRVSTGATLPENTAQVLKQEDCQFDSQIMQCNSLTIETYIRPRASEAKAGSTILPQGTQITPAELTILAQLGITHPTVHPLPKILHLATGSELVPPSQSPSPGQIRDSNSSLIHGLLSALHITPDSHHVPDEPTLLSQHLTSPFDLLLISGGASVGLHDHGADVLKKNGFKIHFNQVNLRPGKPLTFATRGHQAAFIIPGNPLSHFTCFHLAIHLAIQSLAAIPHNFSLLDLPITNPETLRKNPRETYWPATVHHTNGTLTTTAKPWL